MKKLILLSSISLLLFSCNNVPDTPVQHTYKYVTEISTEVNTYNVTVTEQSGGNTFERGAGGAIIGGATSWLLGSSAKSGAVVGGLIGAATTSSPSTESHVEQRKDIIYTIKYNDSTIDILKNYCPYTIGDSIIIH